MVGYTRRFYGKAFWLIKNMVIFLLNFFIHGMLIVQRQTEDDHV